MIFYTSMIDDEKEKSLFAKRYEEFRFLCFNVAYDILQDKGLAEDAVHEAFLSVATHREKYLPLSCRDFRRSIVVIVKNKSIDILRKNKNTTRFAPDDDVFVNLPDDSNVESQVLRQVDIQHMSDLLNHLNDVSRQILIMKYVEGMSYKQIGAELNMAVKTVEVRIARAKKKIRDIVTENVVEIDD